VFSDLRNAASDRVGQPAECISLSYKDADGDEVCLSNDDDLRAAILCQPSNLRVACSVKEATIVETEVAYARTTSTAAGFVVSSSWAFGFTVKYPSMSRSRCQS
jgi:hypothetical protein